MENEYYVYVYLDPRKPGKYKYGEYEFEYEPFYVGKGKGNRFEKHLKEYHQKFDNNKFKVNKIKKIRKLGFEVIVRKLFENLSEENSLHLEIELIKIIGRKDLKLGYLTNLTNGGDGSSGYIHTQDAIQKMKDFHNGKILSNHHKLNISKATNGKLNPMYGVILSGEKSYWFGKKLSKEHKNNLSKSHIGLQSGENHPMNKYVYFLSNGLNFWDLKKDVRLRIMKKFSKSKFEIVEYKGLLIKRKLKV